MQQISHKQSLYRIFFAIILLLSTLPIFSQGVVQYPVQVSTVVLPNPPMYLSAYSGVETDKLSVTLLNRDTQQSSLQVKLRMRIYCSQGQEISSRSESHYTPITLEGGIPLRLSMSDLAAYFRTENLRIAGSLPQGKLPVGHTRFCFEVLEYYTGRLLSSQGCGSAFIVLQTPPLLQQPSHGSLLTDDPTGGILFRWSPQHSVGLERVQYEFILKEMFDTQQSAELGFAHGVEVYRTHTTATSLLYGMMHPPLIAGKRYVWQVRAFTDPISGAPLAFENNGQSRVFTFDIDYPCQAPQHIIATAHNNGIHLTWDASPHPSASYHLSYRRKDFSSTWHQAVTTANSYTISNLTPGANYEYKVGISCTNKTNDIRYSTVAHIAYNPNESETPSTSIQTKVKECGKSTPNNISNTEPKETLWAGDVIYAGDFTITLSTVQGSNGRFTGEGKVHVPYLSGIGMSVYFSDISINTDNQLIEGKIHTVYDESRGTIIDLDAFDHGGTTTPAQGVLVPNYEFDFALTNVTRIHNDPLTNSLIFYDATGSRVGNYELTGTAPTFPILVSDKEGNMYSINETNKDNPPANYTLVAIGKQIGELAGNAFDRNVVDSHKGTVTFFDAGVGTYSFDEFLPQYDNINYIRYSSENGNERLYPQLGAKYYVPWKFVPLNTHDKVQAQISLDPNSELQPERVVFITESGTQVPASYNASDSTYQVSVTGTSNSGVHTLYALYPKGDGTSYFHLGQLRIDSRPPQHLKLVLVYAGGSYDKIAVANELNTIYNRVGIHWQVSEVQNFTYDKEAIKTLFDQKSGLLSAYNDRMTSLNQALQSHLGDSYQSDACYVFMADASQAGNDRDVVGFMPRGRQYGYIYTKDLNASKIGSILAHELAHGKFKLYHTFDNIYAGKLAQGSTTNLMDYTTGGTHLAKWQWNQLYDPAILNGVFDRDERGMFAGMWAVTPDYKNFITIPNVDNTCDTPNKLGTLSCIYVDSDNVYKWNEQKEHYYNKDEQTLSTDAFAMKSIAQGLSDNDNIILFYNMGAACSIGTYSIISYKDLKKELQQTTLEQYLSNNQLKRNNFACPQEHFQASQYASDLLQYYLNNRSVSDNSTNDNSNALIEKLVQKVNTTQKNTSQKDSDLLGEVLADKLKTYEEFNGRKFIVVAVMTNVLNTNQQQWQSIARDVFVKCGLSANDILITIPYFHLQEITGTAGYFYYMPGYHIGSNVKFNKSGLQNSYPNDQIASGNKFPLSEFILDVFTHTEKKSLLYHGLYNSSNTIETIVYQSPAISGKPYNKKIELYRESSYHQLAEIAQEWQAKRDILYANNLRFGTTAHVLTAHSTNLDTELRFYQYTLNKLNAEYRIKIAQKVEELAKTDNHLEPYTPPEEYLYIFKEEYIDKKYSTNEEDNATHYIHNKAFVPLQKELKYPYVDKINTSTTFTHNRSYFTDHVDKYVYPTIDAVSVLFSIFAPSLDAIPDGIGLFYSTLRGNTGNISNYTIALTIPAASALSVKAIKQGVAKQQGKNVFRVVNNTVEATANATDEAARELLTKHLTQGDISQEAYNQLINKQGKELRDGLLKALDDEYDRFYKALSDNAGAGVKGAGRFIAKTGNELSVHLNAIVNKPLGKSYSGDIYRSLSKSSETNFGALPNQMTDHHIYSSWGRYDLPGEENAMYLSKTITENQTELVPHYGEWNDFTTYKYTNVQADNLLDLTDDVVRQQLGTEFEQLTKVLDDKGVMYEFTNELAKWARQNGYNGLIVPGARGAKNYENVIIFNQTYINQILKGKTAIPIPK